VTVAAPSPWLADLPPVEPAPALEGERRVDVAIVGAGYTGLCTALALRAEGASVAVLEAETAGFGASGRNAGILAPEIGKEIASLPRTFGRERSRALVGFVEDAIRHVEGLIERLAIDCDYRPAGNVLCAVHPSQHARLERAARIAQELGARAEWLGPEDLRKRGIPPSFTAGILQRPGGTLHPGRYVRGLRTAALAAGAELYEHSPVVRLDPGPRAALATPRGRVSATHVVLATNAYPPALRRLRRLAAPVWASMFRTEPLGPDAEGALEWRGGEGLHTIHELFECYQRTADGRIVGGGKAVHYRFGGRAVPEAPRATRAVLERALRDRFPDVAARIETFWTGPFAFTLDFVPALGTVGRERNVVYSIAYAGHGLSLASYAGRLVADEIAGRDGPGRLLASQRHLPFPPEPLRWLALRSADALLSRLDARLDRKVRAERPR